MIQKSFESYKASLDTHPNLFRAFDLVHYEDSVYLQDILTYLFEEKKKDTRVKFAFHAGETLKETN